MEWSLAIVALTVLGVAAVSRRLSGTPVTPAMVFVAVGLLVGPEVLDEVGLDSTSSTVRALAEATLALVLFCDASRVDLRQLRREVGVPLRLLGIGLPPTIALGALAAAGIFGQLTVEEANSGSSWRRPTPLWGRRWSPSHASRSASARLNVESGLNDGICVPLLFAAVAVADVEVGDLGGARRRDAAARGDWLRRPRCCGRAPDRGDRRPSRPPRSDRASVATGHPGAGAALAYERPARSADRASSQHSWGPGVSLGARA